MRKVMSEDSARRAFKQAPPEDTLQWLRRHLRQTSCMGHGSGQHSEAVVRQAREGGESYNPTKPGRPSHVVHTYLIACLGSIRPGGRPPDAAAAAPPAHAFSTGRMQPDDLCHHGARPRPLRHAGGAGRRCGTRCCSGCRRRAFNLLAIVRKQLDKTGVKYEYLDGSTNNRQKHVEAFQNDPACELFLISLKAGGLGLNLTAAEYVFLLDPWWNPAVEAQAVDRAHRIGQTRPVFA
jgi:Helicase conserved C-terminal domain